MDVIQTSFKDFTQRLEFIEGIFEAGQGKNVIFDSIMNAVTNQEVERLKLTV
jgi:hypothetical protein